MKQVFITLFSALLFISCTNEGNFNHSTFPPLATKLQERISEMETTIRNTPFDQKDVYQVFAKSNHV